MKRAKWQHWQNPTSKKWDSLSYKNGNVLHISKQNYAKETTCLNAIESSSGSRDSELVEFKNRFKSRKKPPGKKKTVPQS